MRRRAPSPWDDCPLTSGTRSGAGAGLKAGLRGGRSLGARVEGGGGIGCCGRSSLRAGSGATVGKHPLRRQSDDHLGSAPKLRADLERATVQLDQAFHDRQSKTRAALGGLVRERALPEGLDDFWELLARDAGAGIADREYWPPFSS